MFHFISYAYLHEGLCSLQTKNSLHFREIVKALLNLPKMQWLLYNYTESCLCVCIRESFCVWMCVCLSIYLSVFLSIYHSFSLSIIIHSFYIFLYYRRPTLVVKTAWKPDIKRGPPRGHRQGLPPPLTTAGLVYPPPPFNG